MAPRKKQQAPPTPMNAAPNYNPNAAPAPSWQPPPPQGSAQGAFTPPNGNVTPGAPPPRGDRNPFLNAPWLWANGDQSNMLRPVQAKIIGVRQATGGRAEFNNRGGFFLDVVLTNGTKMTARVNIGDTRHERLYSKFGGNWVGQLVIFRLSHPGDQTKAPWTVE